MLGKLYAAVLTGTASSSKTTLWGKPALLVQVTVSPDLMVTVAGSKTRLPESAPSLTVASAWAAMVRAREATPTAAPWAIFCRLATGRTATRREVAAERAAEARMVAIFNF